MEEQLKVEYIDIDKLKPYINNAKIHTDEQIEQIKLSIKEFGFNDPIAVWSNNEVIEGHGRLTAAKEMGMKEVPILRLNELSDDQRKAYMLVHNQLTMETGMDLEKIAEQMKGRDIDLAPYDITVPDSIDEDIVYTTESKKYEPKEYTEYVICPQCHEQVKAEDV